MTDSKERKLPDEPIVPGKRTIPAEGLTFNVKDLTADQLANQVSELNLQNVKEVKQAGGKPFDISKTVLYGTINPDGTTTIKRLEDIKEKE